MIKKSIKEFFTNGNCFFAACGIIYLIFLIIVIAVIWIAGALVKSLSAEAIVQINAEIEIFLNTLGHEQSFDISYYSGFVKNIWAIIMNNTQHFTAIFISVAVAAVGMLTLGITYATHLCRKMIKENTRKLSFGKSLGAFVLRLVSVLIFLMLYALISSKWKYGMIPLIFITVIFIILENLFATWLIYYRKHPLRRFLNFKTIASLLVAYLVVLLCLGAVVLLCNFLFGTVISLLIILPLVAYTLGVLDSVSVSFFEDKFSEQADHE